MWFVDADGGKRLITMTNCTDDIKKWLFEDVFTYRFPDSFPAPDCGPVPPELPAIKHSDLNGRIDAILIELLELKKNIIQLNV